MFFFQLVLTGGGGRAARSARTHQAANYGVFELAHEGATDAFMGELLCQHGRLSSRLPSQALWLCLRDSQALPVDVLGAFAVAERTATDLNWGYEYALLTTHDPAFHEPLARHLAAALDGEAEPAEGEAAPAAGGHGGGGPRCGLVCSPTCNLSGARTAWLRSSAGRAILPIRPGSRCTARPSG